MAQDFCFLKGLVDCSSGRVQDCNFKHVNKCPMEAMLEAEEELGKNKKKEMVFCFLKGVVNCNVGRVQDCNFKHVRKCPLNK